MINPKDVKNMKCQMMLAVGAESYVADYLFRARLDGNTITLPKLGIPNLQWRIGDAETFAMFGELLTEFCLELELDEVGNE